jgi:hypothetical protein
MCLSFCSIPWHSNGDPNWVPRTEMPRQTAQGVNLPACGAEYPWYDQSWGPSYRALIYSSNLLMTVLRYLISRKRSIRISDLTRRIGRGWRWCMTYYRCVSFGCDGIVYINWWPCYRNQRVQPRHSPARKTWCTIPILEEFISFMLYSVAADDIHH